MLTVVLFESILAQARALVRRAVKPGDTVVDATVGNGHDTLFLAHHVGPEGRVIGFDIQPRALDATRLRLHEAGLEARVRLVLRGHQELAAWFADSTDPLRPSAVMFNLGYLPKGDHSVITRADTTVAALGASLQLLAPGGVITIAVYPGHEGGSDEAEAVPDWARRVPPALAQTVCRQVLNTRRTGPFLVAVAARSRRRSPDPF